MRLSMTKARIGRKGDEATIVVVPLASPLPDVIRFLRVFALSRREAKELTTITIKTEKTGKRVAMALTEVGNGRKREVVWDHAILL
jgi:hypothetical protein